LRPHRRYAITALKIARQIQSEQLVANALFELAKAKALLGERDVAIAHSIEALDRA
jgi:hypothetical protein